MLLILQRHPDINRHMAWLIALLRPLSLRIAWRVRAIRRADVRNSEPAITMLAVLIGLVVGGGVIVLQLAVAGLHALAYDIPFDGHLSDGVDLAAWRVLAMPCLGGLLVGGTAWALRRWRPRDTVDAIEANALYGGRMSLIDSLNLGLLTVLSAGFGGSVGMEAAYTQLGAGVASRAGRDVNLRRNDLRTMVGCGAAAAIGAAFNAPLAGAFYAFELVIGSYTIGTLAPVAAAALVGSLIARLGFNAGPIFVVTEPIHLRNVDFALFVLVGLGAAALAISAMTGVTWVERWFRRLNLPTWARPVFGGLAVGVLGLVYPQVLGSGHGAILFTLHTGIELPLLLGLILAKTAASAISVGSGFRGGLFSSGLFLGTLFGSAAATVLAFLPLPGTLDPIAYTLVGMGAVAAGVVGAPITMIMLVLETTGDFTLAVGVMIGVITASMTVRQTFGYSFATWRFHLRGLSIRSARDIGWIEDLTVRKLSRRDAPVTDAGATLANLRTRFPQGGAKFVFVVDDAKRLIGTIDSIDIHNVELDDQTDALSARDLIESDPTFLLPGANVRAALDKFVSAQAEVLPVVDHPDTRHVVGFVTEAYALRRYNQELERKRAEDAGDGGVFVPEDRAA